MVDGRLENKRVVLYFSNLMQSRYAGQVQRNKPEEGLDVILASEAEVDFLFTASFDASTYLEALSRPEIFAPRITCKGVYSSSI